MTLLLSLLLAVLAPSIRSAPTPCYVIVTAIVSTPTPYIIHRVVTTGIRRYTDAGTGTPSYCTPADAQGALAAQRAVDARVYDAARSSSVEHVVVHSTSPDIAGMHLRNLVAKAASTPGSLKGVEVVALKDARGQEADTVPLPPLFLDPKAHSTCVEENAALERTNAAFHWAC